MANLKYKHTAYTSAQWASLNPVIVENEIVIESDTKRTKIGNGISTYNQLGYADANSIGSSLGSIKPTDAAPTPVRNGNYTFSIGGNKPAWLTAEAGITEVKAGDGVAVVYDGVSAYTYTHVDVSSEFAQELTELKNEVKPSLRIYNNIILGKVYAFGPISGDLEPNALYDCTEPIKIIGSVGSTIKTTGAIIYRYIYWNSSTPSNATYVGKNTTGIIPVGATYFGIDFLKTDNASGYLLLDISQDKSVGYRNDIDLINTELNLINTELNSKVPFEITENTLLESTKTPEALPLGGTHYAIGSCLTGLNGTYEKIILNITQKSASPVTKIKLYKGSGSSLANALTTLLDEITVDSSLLIVGLNEINLTSPITLISTDYLTVFVGIATTGITFKHTVCRDGDAVTMKNAFYQTMVNANTNTYSVINSPILTPANYGLWWKIKTTPSIPQEYLPNYEQTLEDLDARTSVVESKTLSLENAVNGLKTIKNQAKTLCPVLTNKFNSIKPQFKDIYCVSVGDSIAALQNSGILNPSGVSRVPPVCDRFANMAQFWEANKWGNPQYRRFDDGKKSLLGSYTTAWTDDSQSFFVENGSFNTEYIGSVRRAAWGNNDPVQTTHVDFGSFLPNAFDISEASWYQRNIPKRFSSDSNASIQFVIPSGYNKFDFIYHAHVNADIVTITTNRNNGIVKMSDIQNDWNNAVEANSATKDLSAFNTGSGDDTYGVPNKRLHFQISDTSVNTIITITKSSNTSKYLIYWGITYWGTSDLPYAFHLDVMAIGGYTLSGIYALRGSMLKATNPNAILLEICFNNINNSSFSIQMQSVSDNLDLIKTYLSDVENVGIWIPHKGGTNLNSIPDILKMNHSYSEKLVIEKGYTLLGSVSKLFKDLTTVYYPSTTLSNFMLSIGDIHLNDSGHSVYGAFWESI